MDIHLPLYANEVMTPDLWKNVIYFTPEENWGNPYMMDVQLIFYVDMFRDLLGLPVDVYCAYESKGHSPTGMHPKGKAVDLSPRGLDDNLFNTSSIMDAFLLAIRLPFTGVGLYKGWKPRAGLHLDMKPSPYDKAKRVWYRDARKIYHNLYTYQDLQNFINEE